MHCQPMLRQDRLAPALAHLEVVVGVLLAETRLDHPAFGQARHLHRHRPAPVHPAKVCSCSCTPQLTLSAFGSLLGEVSGLR